MSYGDKLLFLGQGKKCECEERESGKFAITRPLRWCRKERATPQVRRSRNRPRKLHQKARKSILTSHSASRWCIHAYCNLGWNSCRCTARVVLAVCATAVHDTGAAAGHECADQGTTDKSELTATEQ